MREVSLNAWSPYLSQLFTDLFMPQFVRRERQPSTPICWCWLLTWARRKPASCMLMALPSTSPLMLNTWWVRSASASASWWLDVALYPTDQATHSCSAPSCHWSALWIHLCGLFWFCCCCCIGILSLLLRCLLLLNTVFVTLLPLMLNVNVNCGFFCHHLWRQPAEFHYLCNDDEGCCMYHKVVAGLKA